MAGPSREGRYCTEIMDEVSCKLCSGFQCKSPRFRCMETVQESWKVALDSKRRVHVSSAARHIHRGDLPILNSLGASGSIG